MQYICILLIIGGAVILSCAMRATEQILSVVVKPKRQKEWLRLQRLMRSFLLGYLLACGLVILDSHQMLVGLTSMVFFGGACFVLLSVRLGHSTLRDLQENHRLSAEVAEATAERKKARALRVAYDELRETQAQLIQASKLAALGEMGAGLAHELNQPLTSLILISDLLLQNESEAEVRRELRKIRSAGQRMKSIISGILTFARQEHYQAIPTEALSPLEAAVGLVSEGFKLKGVHLKIDPSRDLPPVMGDTVRLQQVFLNLLSNARDSVLETSRPSEILVTVRADPDYVHYKFSDNGTGVSSENLPKIFDPFFTTKQRGNGTGLGLSLSYGILAEHGGDLRYEPKPEGASFVASVPVSSTPVQNSKIPRTRLERPSKSFRILVVDDEKAVASTISRVFRKAGHEVHTETNPVRALSNLQAGIYSLLISDLSMPEMSGNELCAQALQIDPTLPILVMSGYFTPGAEAELEKLGVRATIAKPFNSVRDLLQLVEQHGRDPSSPVA